MMSIYGLVYERLVTIDDDYLPAPGLAEAGKCPAPARPGPFTCGKTLPFPMARRSPPMMWVATAQHILDRAQDEYADDKGYYRNLTYFISSISASDDYTVVVKAKPRILGPALCPRPFPFCPRTGCRPDNPPAPAPM